MKIKIAFFGTQDFAATILAGILTDKSISIEAVFTQPDRKVGRKQILEESPVKKLALKHNLNIAQPESLKNFELTPSTYDLAVVAQYGLIIPKNIIESFPRGMINVHGSILPKYRGASPIQASLILGKTTTGITIMLMDELVDHGPILAQKSLPIDPDDTFTTLAEKMALEGSKLLLNTLPGYLDDSISPQIQDHSQATFTGLLTKEGGKIDFSKSADEIYNLYRGLTPWPGVWCLWNEKRLKLLKIFPISVTPKSRILDFASSKIGTKSEKNLPAGEVLVENKRIFVGCGKNSSIEVLELQLEGKNAMSAEVFANGYKDLNRVKLV